MSQDVAHQAPTSAQGHAQLTPKQNLAIGHLLAGRSYSQTAELVNVDRQTIYRWRKEPAFVALLDDMSHEALEVVAMRVRNMLLRGTDKLERKIANETNFSETLRFVANKRVWEMANVMPTIFEEDVVTD